MVNIPEVLNHPDFAALHESIMEELHSIDRTGLLIHLIKDAPEEALPYLARDFNVNTIEWSLADTTEKKRTLLADYIELHKYKGTRWAIERIFEILGYTAVTEITEWWESGGSGDPYHFDIDMDISGTGHSKLSWEMLTTLLSDYKRAVTDYKMTLHSLNYCDIVVATVTQSTEYITLYPSDISDTVKMYPSTVLFSSSGGLIYSDPSDIQNITDDDPATYASSWAYTFGSYTTYWQCNFENQFILKRLSLLSSAPDLTVPKRYHFEYWNGSDWQIIEETVTEESSPQATYEKEFSITGEIITSQLRLVIKEAFTTLSWWQSHRINELQIYGVQ